MRQIKAKNYVIVVLLFVVTILAVLFCKDIYLKRKKYEQTTNDRVSVLYEVKEDDLKSYFVEHSETMIYVSNSSNEAITEFEEAFNKYISEEELSKEIVYLNLDKVSSTFYQELTEKYYKDGLTKEVVSNQANLFAVKDGKICAILYTKETPIQLEDVKRFVRINNVGNK